MLRKLIEKELAHHLLDRRFLVISGLCLVLAALSAYVGVTNYAIELREYGAVSESGRRAFQENSLDKGRLMDLVYRGYRSSRRPEVLGSVVYGLSGSLGREVRLHYQGFPALVTSAFEADPIRLLFDVLDFSLMVNLIFSLCALVFVYDAICGEKEAGTLGLLVSFPVSRATLALAKVAGSCLAVFAPFVVGFFLVAAVLALTPDISLNWDDWARVLALMATFGLYLLVFSAFGLLVSALFHRRVTAFLVLAALWAVWVFVVPGAALEAAGRTVPLGSYYDVLRRANESQWVARKAVRQGMAEYERRNMHVDWDSLSEADREGTMERYRSARHQIEAEQDKAHLREVSALRQAWRDARWTRGRLAYTLSSLSPVGSLDLLCMDLARTGPVQQDQLEDAADAYLTWLNRFVLERQLEGGGFVEGADLSGFSWFSFESSDTVGECLSRNILAIINLLLLAVLGFAGAFVAMLRYDVR